jgi:hypothetical protein
VNHQGVHMAAARLRVARVAKRKVILVLNPIFVELLK